MAKQKGSQLTQRKEKSRLDKKIDNWQRKTQKITRNTNRKTNKKTKTEIDRQEVSKKKR